MSIDNRQKEECVCLTTFPGPLYNGRRAAAGYSGNYSRVQIWERRYILMFLDGLDDVDQKIVSLLIQNARMPYSEIGQQIGLSRVAVKMRVQALEQKGIIEEYTTVINPQKISGAVSCYFEIETKPDALMEVAGILQKNDTVTQIYRVTGKCRLHVHAVASSNEEMEDLICHTIDRLPGVLECSCSTILSRIKDIKGLRL